MTWLEKLAARSYINERGCFVWCGPTAKFGYGRGWFYRKKNLVHRVAWIEHHGEPPPATPFVLHHCDNPPCWNEAHLFLGTHATNEADMRRKGRAVNLSGESHRLSKLTAAAALSIYRDGRPQRVVAAEYGVSVRQVARVRLGLSWAAVTGGVPAYTKVAPRKLTASQAAAIRVDRRSRSVIAKQYGVSETTVFHIRRGNSWRAAMGGHAA